MKCPVCESKDQTVSERTAVMTYYGRRIEYRRRYVTCGTCGLEYLRVEELLFNNRNSQAAIKAAGFPFEVVEE
jgi:transcriptional regulator NrdR family protein